MSKEKAPIEPIELPGLENSKFDLITADLRVATGGLDLKVPQLLLEGDDDAFEHTFRNGNLSLREGSDSNVTVISSGSGRRSIRIGSVFSGVVISGSSVTVNGQDILRDTQSVASSARRRASLLLPQRHLASHNINNMTGDVELEELTMRVLNIATQSGDIAVKFAEADSAAMNTMSGDIEVEDLRSAKPVSAKTMSGDIDVLGSSAPHWRLTTMSGDVTYKATYGDVDPKTMSGRIRISR